MTLAGVLLDEVALMPRSFVEQAMARCSVPASRMWFNCNPGGPEHWFYKEWVCKLAKRNALHLHFTMADNLSLAPSIRERYERQYSGVFYRRYIQGEWCLAEGLVYEFDKQRHVTSVVPDAGRYFISVDYGTLNPFSAGLWCYRSAGLSPAPLAASTAVQEVLSAGLEKTNGFFTNLTKTTANTATRQFERALDRAYMQVSSGAFSPATAIRGAIKDLCKQGLSAITYPSGHTDSVEVAVRRATITGINQTTGKVQEAQRNTGITVLT